MGYAAKPVTLGNTCTTMKLLHLFILAVALIALSAHSGQAAQTNETVASNQTAPIEDDDVNEKTDQLANNVQEAEKISEDTPAGCRNESLLEAAEQSSNETRVVRSALIGQANETLARNDTIPVDDDDKEKAERISAGIRNETHLRDETSSNETRVETAENESNETDMNETMTNDDQSRNNTLKDNGKTHDNEDKNTEKRHAYPSTYYQTYEQYQQQEPQQQQQQQPVYYPTYGGKGSQTGQAYQIHEEQAKLLQYQRTIPGVPGQDYPILYSVPQTGFQCPGLPGLYGDDAARCQSWHFCQEGGKMDSFLCPNGSLFNQQYLVCDWWYNVDCQLTRQFYGVNQRYNQLYGNRPGFGYNKGHDYPRPAAPQVTTYRPIEVTTPHPVYPSQPSYVVPQVPRVVVTYGSEKGDYGGVSSTTTASPAQNYGQGGQSGGYGQEVHVGSYGQGESSGSYGQGGVTVTYVQGTPSGSYDQGGASATYGQGSSAGTYGQSASSGAYGKGASSAGTHGQGASSGAYGQGASSATYGQGSSRTYGQSAPSGAYGQGASSVTYSKGASSGSYGQGSSSGSYGQGSSSGSYGQGSSSGSYGQGSSSGSYGQGSSSGTYGQGTSSRTYGQGGSSSVYVVGAAPSKYGQIGSQATYEQSSSSGTYGQGSVKSSGNVGQSVSSVTYSPTSSYSKGGSPPVYFTASTLNTYGQSSTTPAYTKGSSQQDHGSSSVTIRPAGSPSVTYTKGGSSGSYQISNVGVSSGGYEQGAAAGGYAKGVSYGQGSGSVTAKPASQVTYQPAAPARYDVNKGNYVSQNQAQGKGTNYQQFGYQISTGQQQSSSYSQGYGQQATAGTQHGTGVIYPNPTAVSQEGGSGYRYVYSNVGQVPTYAPTAPRPNYDTANRYPSSDNTAFTTGPNGAFEYSYSNSYPGSSSSVFQASYPRPGTAVKSGYQYPAPQQTNIRVQTPSRAYPPTLSVYRPTNLDDSYLRSEPRDNAASTGDHYLGASGREIGSYGVSSTAPSTNVHDQLLNAY